VQLAPRIHPGAHKAWQQGLAAGRKGDWSVAARHYTVARRLQPDDSLYSLNLADAWLKCGQPERALEMARAVCQAEPRNAPARDLQVNALLALYRFDDLCRLLEGWPSEELELDRLVILGAAQVQTGRSQAAVGTYLQALARDPAQAQAHYRLGQAFNELRLKSEAAECFRTALLLGMGDLEVGVRDLLVFYEREVCHWAGLGIDALRSSIERLPGDAAIINSPFAHVTLLDDPLLQRKAAQACARHHERQSPMLPPRAIEPRERLRIGYVSADFHNHATAFLMAELVERHDRMRFEIHMYSHGPRRDDACRHRLARGADVFVDCLDLSPEQMARRIRADGIDILVDLKGYTRDARPAVFAYRPAPVQVAYLGFPGTTGSSRIDYIIGDPWVTPLEHAAHYTEKIAQLPGCYQCNDGTRPLPVAPPRSSQGLPEDALVLCGFNQPYKISPEVFDVWCRLLHQLPKAVLWLLAWNDQAPVALRREAVARGIDPSRLVFAPAVAQAEHLARAACADLVLDTGPCNGHTTASDMLWAGVPVVTWSGRTFASRVAGSLLQAVGGAEVVCADAAAYEDLALALALDSSRRTALRSRLEAGRRASPLFSSQALAPHLDALYERMWARASVGLAPDHLPAKA